MTTLTRFLSRNTLLERESDTKDEDRNANKTSVIAMAAVATVLVLAFIAGGVYFFIRRRGRKNRAKRHGKPDSTDRSINSPHDPVSKTPLIRQGNVSQMSEYQGVPAPSYDEEDDIAMSAPEVPNRTMSRGSMQSLPPSYDAATHAGVARTVSQNSHRPMSSRSGSDGLRPLMLLTSRQSFDGHDGEPTEERGRSGHPAKPDRSSLILPAGRPRAGSRFREEDLDI